MGWGSRHRIQAPGPGDDLIFGFGDSGFGDLNDADGSGITSRHACRSQSREHDGTLARPPVSLGCRADLPLYERLHKFLPNFLWRDGFRIDVTNPLYLNAISPRLSTVVASVCPLAPPKSHTRSPRVSFQLIVGPCQVTLQTWLSQLRRLALE